MQEQDRLPMSVEMGRVPAYPAPVFHPASQGPEEGKLPLSQCLSILKRYHWRIGGGIALTLIGTVSVSSKLTPIYESTATVDVDRQTPSGMVGQDSARTVLNDWNLYLATQIKRVQSDSVPRPVDQRFKLRELEHQPGTTSTLSRAGDAPVTLSRLKVTRPPNSYLLRIRYRSDDPKLAADAANAIAQSYLEHTNSIRIRSSASLASFMEKQIEELRAMMERSSQALVGFKRELNAVNPEEKTNIDSGTPGERSGKRHEGRMCGRGSRLVCGRGSKAAMARQPARPPFAGCALAGIRSFRIGVRV
jgi:succinoglycan biosynthesis transport protein ExoP